ncbi:MAG: helix-turn-helix domain-containing protein, partial [Acidobacteria bacterium]|nr:helix-turn-helix domain-containing protein [Acidobacteriota bacterium]
MDTGDRHNASSARGEGGREAPFDGPSRLRAFRGRFGLTQTRLAELLGVSFATVNRWENSQTRPSSAVWKRILLAEEQGLDAIQGPSPPSPAPDMLTAPRASDPVEPRKARSATGLPFMDFGGDPRAVRAVVEAHRRGFGHLLNTAFATEISLIDPLPHQRIA